MAKQKVFSVTMRVRVGEKEIEISGPSDYVEKKIAEFLAQSPGSGPLQTSGHTPKNEPQATKPKSPAQFFRATNPKTDIDRALVAAYFLEKYRNAQNATTAEIRELIKEAKWPPPINPSDALNKNIRKGLLMTAGDRDNKIAFVVTSDGEAAVEEMLNASRE
jgi:hypothetical protein